MARSSLFVFLVCAPLQVEEGFDRNAGRRPRRFLLQSWVAAKKGTRICAVRCTVPAKAQHARRAFSGHPRRQLHASPRAVSCIPVLRSRSHRTASALFRTTSPSVGATRVTSARCCSPARIWAASPRRIAESEPGSPGVREFKPCTQSHFKRLNKRIFRWK